MINDMMLSREEAQARIEGNDLVNANFIKANTDMKKHNVVEIVPRRYTFAGQFLQILDEVCKIERISIQHSHLASHMMNAIDQVNIMIMQTTGGIVLEEDPM